MRRLLNERCNVTLLLLLTVCIAPCALKYLNEPDVWFHMTCGKDMLATGTVDVSKFYFTVVNTAIQDFKFTWLGDIVLYLTYFVGGPVGLQVLRAEVIVLLLYFLWSVSDRRINLFKCLVAVLVVYGSTQLLVVRNSIFSVVFVCALWSLHLNDAKHKHVWSVVILVFWSRMHGSYLLGLCMYGLIAIRSLRSAVLITCVVLVLNHVMHLDIFSYVAWPTSLNLNDTIFHCPEVLSIEFCSPFIVEKPYTVMMLVLSGMHVILIKRVRVVYVVIFLATFIPALGYIRMVGYHVITCGMCLMYAERKGDLRSPVHYSLLLSLVLLVGYHGWKYNSVNIGLGVSPVFSSVKDQTITRNVLTQDYLSSYMYFTYGVKGFVSTFHAPHPPYVWDAYKSYMGDPDVIDSSINTCIVKDKVYAGRFFSSTKWVGSKQGHVYIFNRRGVM